MNQGTGPWHYEGSPKQIHTELVFIMIKMFTKRFELLLQVCFEFKMILIIDWFVINVLGTYTMCLEGGDWPTLFDSNIPQVIKKKPF